MSANAPGRDLIRPLSSASCNAEGSQESITIASTPEDPEKEPEKQGHTDNRDESADDGIEYRYLTFEETDIYPQDTKELEIGSSPSPPAPDLRKYENPQQWPEPLKELHAWLCFFGTLVAAFTPGAYLAATQQLQDEFHVSATEVAAGLTVFTGCFAIAPMVLAPFSEIVGRKPVFTITGVIYVVSQLGAGVTSSFAGLMISRATGGIAASTFSSMVGGVISDVYSTRDRNRPMVIFTTGTLAGTGLGPAVASIMVQHLSWRWTWYLQTITCGLVVLAQFIFLRETRGSVLLSRKAQALNAWYAEREEAFPSFAAATSSGNKPQRKIRWKVKSDEERASILTIIKISLVRPFHLLLTEPILFWFSAWVSFAWMILYLTFGGIPLLFTTNHGFDSQANGLVFFAIVVSSIVFGFVCTYQEKLGLRSIGGLRRVLRFADDAPESRLYFVCVESVLFPIGIFWLAWTQFASVHWIVPTLAIGVMNMGIFVVYLAAFNYLVDVYHVYASSAIAAQSFCRNMLGATIPLYNDQMLEKMTFQGGLSFLGGVATVLALVPWVLLIWGPAIRARSRVARMLENGR